MWNNETMFLSDSNAGVGTSNWNDDDDEDHYPSTQNLENTMASISVVDSLLDPSQWEPCCKFHKMGSVIDILRPANSLKENLQPVSMLCAMEDIAIPEKMPFLIAYVAAVIDENNAILMVPASDVRSEMTIRMTKNTAVGDSDKYIDCSTLFLTQEVWVYLIVRAMDNDVMMLPTLSAARFIATSVTPRGPIPSEFSTIGFAYAGSFDVLTIVTDETPFGSVVNRSIIRGKPEERCQEPCLGEMYIVKVYPLRNGTLLRKMPDLDFYVTDDKQSKTVFRKLDGNIYNSDIKGISEITRATKVQKNMCRWKGYPMNLKAEDQQLFIGRGSASMAAFEVFTRNIGKDQYVVRSSSQILMDTFGKFTSCFSFPCFGSDEEVAEVWAVGASINAVFPAGMSYQVPVVVKHFARRHGEGFAIVEFPETASEFLMSWNTVWNEGDIVYTPSGADDIVFKTIQEGYREFAVSDLFQQYVAAQKPTISRQNISNEQMKTIGEIQLDQFQMEALENILCSNGISLTQAPPGSGKTVLVAAVTKEWIRSGEAETVIITGSSNIAVDNALNTLTDVVDDLDGFRPIRVASQKAMLELATLKKEFLNGEKAMGFENYISSEHHRRKLARMRGLYQQLTENAMQPAESEEMVVDRYVQVRNARRNFEDSFMKVLRPNVIATTTSLLLRNKTKPAFRDVTHLIIDEASQMAPTEFLAILVAFPNLKKVAIIGDEYQLQPYSTLPDDSDARKYFGTSDLIRLNMQFGGSATKLKRIYRSHPLMTLNMINSFYPYQLEAGSTFRNRNMAEEFQLPTCNDGTPVRAYHVEGYEFKGRNEEEACAICQFVKNLGSTGVHPEEILVLTFHRSQKSLLEQHLPHGVRVRTVDSAQGQQAPITIVATTKTSQSDCSSTILGTLQFIANRNRGTVALSRGLEATYIFGNLKQLVMTSFWGPVIESLHRRNGTSHVYSNYMYPGPLSVSIPSTKSIGNPRSFLFQSAYSNYYQYSSASPSSYSPQSSISAASDYS